MAERARTPAASPSVAAEVVAVGTHTSRDPKGHTKELRQLRTEVKNGIRKDKLPGNSTSLVLQCCLSSKPRRFKRLQNSP